VSDNSFDDFYDKLMDEKMNHGETFNEFAESVFTVEERERMFGYIEVDGNDDIWVTDIEDRDFKVKIESMDDFYAFLAKQKLAGGKEW
jgi:hypothetical protein